jgi:hypothetical protein
LEKRPDTQAQSRQSTLFIVMMTRLPTVTNSSSKIQLDRISHVYFEHPDLEAFDQFALHFGLVEAFRDEDVILYHGYGVDSYCYVAKHSRTGSPSFGGGAFVARTQSDFDKATALDGATVSDLSPFPGGGKRVTVKTPSGFYIHVISGQEDRKAAEEPVSAQVESLGPKNGSLSKHRFGKLTCCIFAWCMEPSLK